MPDATKDEQWLETIATAFIVAVIFFTAAILAYFWYFHFNLHRSLSTDTQDWALFGDYVGGVVGAMASTMALFFLAISVALQRRTLHATQEEMRAAKTVAERQNFDSRFFASLSVLNQIQQGTQYANDLDLFVNGTRKLLLRTNLSIDDFEKDVSVLLNRHETGLVPYISLLSTLIETIDRADLPLKDCDFYVDTLKSMVQANESLMLAASFQIRFSTKQLESLSCKHNLLRNVSTKDAQNLINLFRNANKPLPAVLNFIHIQTSSQAR